MKLLFTSIVPHLGYALGVVLLFLYTLARVAIVCYCLIMVQIRIIKDWYTVAEVAEIFGVSGDTIRRWNKKGLIKASRTLENHRRFSNEEVERVIALTEKEAA